MLQKSLKNMVYGLVVLLFMAFWAGFLQDTKFAFVIYVLFFIVFVVGVKLTAMTLKSKAIPVLKALLLLTGFSSTIYFLCVVIAVVSGLLFDSGITELMELQEDTLYLVSLLFVVGAIGSLVMLRLRPGWLPTHRWR